MPLSLPAAPVRCTLAQAHRAHPAGRQAPGTGYHGAAKQQAYLLLDCGANVECRPEMLAAFAVMGSCYVNKVEGRKTPA